MSLSPDRVLRLLAEERDDRKRTVASVASVRIDRQRRRPP